MAKNKRSPESIAKQRETIAKKKKRSKKSLLGSKRAFIEAHPTAGVTELVKLGEKNGVSFSAAYVYNVRSAGKGNPTHRGKAKRTPIRQGIDAAIAAELEQSPLDTVFEMMRLAEHASRTLGAGSKKRLLAELTRRLS